MGEVDRIQGIDIAQLSYGERAVCRCLEVVSKELFYLNKTLREIRDGNGKVGK